MKKIISLCVWLGITTVAWSAENQTLNQLETKEIQNIDTVEIKSLGLDGFRYIRQLHNDVDVDVFWNNGVYGKGLTLSFFGEFNSKVHTVKSIETKKVVLEDGTQLETKKIRRQLLSVELGSDQKSFGFKVDLDTDRVTNIKHISGDLEVVQAVGIIEETSSLLEDKVKSKEDKLGISIDLASNWLDGRYFVLLIENADNIRELVILDESGNELKQTMPFKVFGSNNENVKVYVDKEKGKSFAVRLKRAEKLLTQTVPYIIENINLMSY